MIPEVFSNLSDSMILRDGSGCSISAAAVDQDCFGPDLVIISPRSVHFQTSQ